MTEGLWQAVCQPLGPAHSGKRSAPMVRCSVSASRRNSRHVQQIDVAAHAARRAQAQVAAGAVDVAADGDEAVVGAERLHAGAEGVDAVAADEGGGPVGVHAGRGDDLLGRHAGDALRQRPADTARPSRPAASKPWHQRATNALS